MIWHSLECCFPNIQWQQCQHAWGHLQQLQGVSSIQNNSYQEDSKFPSCHSAPEQQYGKSLILIQCKWLKAKGRKITWKLSHIQFLYNLGEMDHPPATSCLHFAFKWIKSPIVTRRQNGGRIHQITTMNHCHYVNIHAFHWKWLPCVFLMILPPSAWQKS